MAYADIEQLEKEIKRELNEENKRSKCGNYPFVKVIVSLILFGAMLTFAMIKVNTDQHISKKLLSNSDAVEYNREAKVVTAKTRTFDEELMEKGMEPKEKCQLRDTIWPIWRLKRLKKTDEYFKVQAVCEHEGEVTVIMDEVDESGSKVGNVQIWAKRKEPGAKQWKWEYRRVRTERVASLVVKYVVCGKIDPSDLELVLHLDSAKITMVTHSEERRRRIMAALRAKRINWEYGDEELTLNIRKHERGYYWLEQSGVKQFQIHIESDGQGCKATIYKNWTRDGVAGKTMSDDDLQDLKAKGW